jgi:hypothetical protein
MRRLMRVITLLTTALVAGGIAVSCSSGSDTQDATTGRLRTHQPSTATTATIPRATPVGTRVCSTIWASTTGDFLSHTQDFEVGPVVFGALLDGGQDGRPNQELVDGVRALVTKNPLTIHSVEGRTVRLTVSDPQDAVRIVYDDAGLAALSQGQYRFREGVMTVDLPAPTACGQGPSGLVQYNGGFVARGPTCATLSVEVDGTKLGSRRMGFAGGKCG